MRAAGRLAARVRPVPMGMHEKCCCGWFGACRGRRAGRDTRLPSALCLLPCHICCRLAVLTSPAAPPPPHPGQVLDMAGKMVAPGVTTDEIDRAVHQMVVEAGAYPSPLNYGAPLVVVVVVVVVALEWRW